MNSVDNSYIFKLAKTSIEHGLIHGAALFLNPRYIDPIYLTNQRTFVSLTMYEKNIGCMGNTTPMMLYNSILINSFQSAFRDNRFPPLNKNSIKKTFIRIYYLNNDFKKIKVKNIDQLVTEIKDNHSLRLIYEKNSAIMLSTMQKEYRTIEDFIFATMDKGKISKRVNWNTMSIELYPTIHTENKKLIEIESCQNYI